MADKYIDTYTGRDSEGKLHIIKASALNDGSNEQIAGMKIKMVSSDGKSTRWVSPEKVGYYSKKGVASPVVTQTSADRFVKKKEQPKPTPKPQEAPKPQPSAKADTKATQASKPVASDKSQSGQKQTMTPAQAWSRMQLMSAIDNASNNGLGNTKAPDVGLYQDKPIAQGNQVKKAVQKQTDEALTKGHEIAMAEAEREEILKEFGLNPDSNEVKNSVSSLSDIAEILGGSNLTPDGKLDLSAMLQTQKDAFGLNSDKSKTSNRFEATKQRLETAKRNSEFAGKETALAEKVAKIANTMLDEQQAKIDADLRAEFNAQSTAPAVGVNVWAANNAISRKIENRHSSMQDICDAAIEAISDEEISAYCRDAARRCLALNPGATTAMIRKAKEEAMNELASKTAAMVWQNASDRAKAEMPDLAKFVRHTLGATLIGAIDRIADKGTYRQAQNQAVDQWASEHPVVAGAGTAIGMATDVTNLIPMGGTVTGKVLGWGAKKAGMAMSKKVGGRMLESTMIGRALTAAELSGRQFGRYEALTGTAQQIARDEDVSFWTPLMNYLHGQALGAPLGISGALMGGVTRNVMKGMEGASRTAQTAAHVGMKGAEFTTELGVFTTSSMVEKALADGDFGVLLDADEWSQALADNTATLIGLKLGGKVGHAATKSTVTTAQGIINDLITKTPHSGDVSVIKFDRNTVKRAIRATPDIIDRWNRPQPEFFPDHVKQELKDRGYDLSKIQDKDLQKAAEEMSNDTHLSAEAKAAAAWVMTGKTYGLPLTTKVSVETEEVLDDNGRPTGRQRHWLVELSENGDGSTSVVRRQECKSTEIAYKRAEEMIDQLMQNKLMKNGAQIAAMVNDVQLGKACDMVASELYPDGSTSGTVVKRRYQDLSKSDPDKLSDEDRALISAVKNAYTQIAPDYEQYKPKGVRERIEAETGVDLKDALNTKEKYRTQEQHEAISAYAQALEHASQRADFGDGKSNSYHEGYQATIEEQQRATARKAEIESLDPSELTPDHDAELVQIDHYLQGAEQRRIDESEYAKAVTRRKWKEYANDHGVVSIGKMDVTDGLRAQRQVIILNDDDVSMVIFDPATGEKRMVSSTDVREITDYKVEKLIEREHKSIDQATAKERETVSQATTKRPEPNAYPTTPSYHYDGQAVDPTTAEMPEAVVKAVEKATSRRQARRIIEDYNLLTDLCTTFGRKIVWDGENWAEGERGYVDSDGILHLNPDMDDLAQCVKLVLGHELTHSTEGTSGYATLAEWLKNSPRGKELLRLALGELSRQVRSENTDLWDNTRAMTWDEYVDSRLTLYNERGKGIDRQGAEAEAMADAVGYLLDAHTTEIVEAITGRQRGFLSKIADRLWQLAENLGIERATQRKALQDFAQRLREALRGDELRTEDIRDDEPRDPTDPTNPIDPRIENDPENGGTPNAERKTEGTDEAQAPQGEIRGESADPVIPEDFGTGWVVLVDEHGICPPYRVAKVEGDQVTLTDGESTWTISKQELRDRAIKWDPDPVETPRQAEAESIPVEDTLTPAEQAEPTPLETSREGENQIPVEEKAGQTDIDYSTMAPADAYDHLMSQAAGDQDVFNIMLDAYASASKKAIKTAEKSVNDARKELDQANKLTPAEGLTGTQLLTEAKRIANQRRDAQANLDKAKQSLAQAKAEAKHWEEIATTPERRIKEIEQERQRRHAERDQAAKLAAKNEKKERDAFINDPEPHNAWEVVAMGLSSHQIDPESYRAETGYGKEEQRQLVGLTKKGGEKMSTVATRIGEDDTSGLLRKGTEAGGVDDLEILNIMNEVLSEGNPRSYVRRHREEEWEREKRAEENHYNNLVYEDRGMDMDDWESHEEHMIDYLADQAKGIDHARYNAEYAESVERINQLLDAKPTTDNPDRQSFISGKKKEEPYLGRVELNVSTSKDPESRKHIRKILSDHNFSQSESDELLGMIDTIGDEVMRISRLYPEVREWQMVPASRRGEGVEMVPKRSAFVKNGDYELNIDLGTLCVKRESLDAMMKILVDEGSGQNLGPSQLQAIRDVLKKWGYLVQCDLCFVETKRARHMNFANDLAQNWNAVCEAIGVDAEFGKGELTPEQREALTAIANGDMSRIDKAKMRRYETKANGEKGDNMDFGLTEHGAKRIAKLMLEDEAIAGRLRAESLMTTEDTEKLLEGVSKTGFPAYLASFKGAATGKPMYGFNVYDPLSVRERYDQGFMTKATPEERLAAVFGIGGVRNQSFTDFNPMLFFDYCQMYLDLQARRLPLHTYTKVPALIELFGETGGMFNMSLVPGIDPSLGNEYAGLKLKPGRKKGSQNPDDYDYLWVDESFPPEKAFELRKRKEYGGRVGTTAVGVSDMQIRKMLADENIDQVIPYHSSGMDAAVKVKTGLEHATDYQDYQTTKYNGKDAKKWDFNEAMQRLKDPHAAAQEYLDWCKENGYTPKFEMFTNEKNYYKMLADFRCIDGDGKPVVQGAVKLKLPENFADIWSNAMKERHGQMKAIDEMKDNSKLMEDIHRVMSKQRLDGDIREEMMKGLNRALGKDNVKALAEREFFDALDKAYQTQGMSAEASREKVEVLRQGDGMVYGFAQGRKITLNENLFNANTPAHEFGHIWAKVVRASRPELWQEGKELLKQSRHWENVVGDELYADIRDNEDAVASEVLSREMGELNEDIIREMMDNSKARLAEKGIKAKILEWLQKAWEVTRGTFCNQYSDLTLEEFIRMPIRDLWDAKAGTEFKKKADAVFKRKKDNPLMSAEVDSNIEHMMLDETSSPTSRQLDFDAKKREDPYAQEKHEIVERAKANGTYMKAPNGKPSKLHPEQWAQVRTKTFKKWFGDWELAAKLFKVVKGDLKFKSDSEIISYMKENFMQEDESGNRKWKTFTNLHSGNVLTIGIKGITKTLSKKAKEQSVSEDAQRTALSRIDEIITNSILGEIHEDRSGDPNIVEMQRYYGAINIDGVVYRVKTTAKKVKAKKGALQNSYYTLEVQEMELIEERPAQQAMSGYNVANDPANSMNSITGAKLLNNVKNSKGEPILNCSKVVDENGEPMVVYHQTNSKEYINKETGQNWKDLDWRERDEWENRDDWGDHWEEQDFYIFDNKNYGRRSVEMPAFFFSPVEDPYHEYGERTIATFLNVRNPAINPTIERAGETNTAGEDAMNRLIEAGHDGFFRIYEGEGKETWEYNAFYPNQIKSATENNGDFSDTNNNFSFSISNRKTERWLPGTHADARKNAYKGIQAIERYESRGGNANVREQARQAARDAVGLYIQTALDAKGIPYLKKSELNLMLKAVARANTSRQLRSYLKQAETIVTDIEIRRDMDRINDLMKTRQARRNADNMSIAGRVDERARKVAETVQKLLADVAQTDVDEQLHDVNRALYNYYKMRAAGIDYPEEIERLQQAKADLEAERDQLRAAQRAEGANRWQTDLEALETRFNNADETLTDEDIDQLMTLRIVKYVNEANILAGRDTADADGNITNMGAESIKERISELKKEKEELSKQLRATTDEASAADLKAKLTHNADMMSAQEDALAQTRLRQSELLRQSREMLEQVVESGHDRLVEQVKAERDRQGEIARDAYSEFKKSGKHWRKPNEESREHRKGIARLGHALFVAPLQSFEYMVQKLSNQLSGEGATYNRFITGKEGLMAAESELSYRLAETKTMLDEASKRILGMDFLKASRKFGKPDKKFTIDVWNEDRQNYDSMMLSKGAGMYINQLWEMADGRMKLQAMGFTEATIDQIRQYIGDDLIAMADWMVENYYPTLRERLNAKYKEMYHVSLPEIENYVPIKIFGEVLPEKNNISEGGSNAFTKGLDKKNGSLINRTVNTLAIDLSRTAFDVLAEHAQTNEEWIAFARVRKDIDYLLNSKTVRNTLNANGRGLYDDLVHAAMVAARIAKEKAGSNSEVLNFLSRGYMSGAIAHRALTAAKQVLSYPAFLAYSQHPKFVGDLMRFTMTPVGNYRWAMQNLPTFKKRIELGLAGSSDIQREIDSMRDGSTWKTLFEKYSKAGMFLNKQVDALTCAAGARAVYNLEYKRLKARGMSEQEAHEAALRKADAEYNATQQTNIGVFKSEAQVAPDFGSRLVTMFQQANISYTRKAILAAGDILKALSDPERLIQTRMEVYGETRKEAQRHIANAASRAIFRLGMHGVGLKALWDASPQLYAAIVSKIASLWNDDDEGDAQAYEKAEEQEDGTTAMSVAREMARYAGWMFQGTIGGNILHDLANGETYNPFNLVTLWEAPDKIGKIYETYGLSPEVLAAVANVGAEVMGVRPDTWGSIVLAVQDLVDNGVDADLAMDVSLAINAPQSSRKQIVRTRKSDYSPVEYAEAMALATKIQPGNHSDATAILLGEKLATGKKVKNFLTEWETANVGADNMALYNEISNLTSKAVTYAKDKNLSDADKRAWEKAHPELGKGEVVVSLKHLKQLEKRASEMLGAEFKQTGDQAMWFDKDETEVKVKDLDKSRLDRIMRLRASIKRKACEVYTSGKPLSEADINSLTALTSQLETEKMSAEEREQYQAKADKKARTSSREDSKILRNTDY